MKKKKEEKEAVRVVITIVSLIVILLASYFLYSRITGKAVLATDCDDLKDGENDFYVDINSQCGNCSDSNSGRINEPFCTISKALNNITSGQTIYVRNGTYREEVVIPASLSGTPESKTVLIAYPGHQPVVQGSDVFTNLTNYKKDVWSIDNWDNFFKVIIPSHVITRYDNARYFVYRREQVFSNGEQLKQDSLFCIKTDNTKDYVKYEFFFEEGNGNRTKDKYYKINGTLINASFDNGVTGKAIKLLGNNSYIDLGKTAELDLQDTYTIMAWVKPADILANRTQVIFSSDYGSQARLGINSDRKLYGIAYNSLSELWSNSFAVDYSNSFENNRWYHVAFVVDSTKFYLYINGNLVTVSYGIKNISNKNLTSYIGKSGQSEAYFNGTIDNVIVYKSSLEGLEIKKEYTKQQERFAEYNFQETYGYWDRVWDVNSANSGEMKNVLLTQEGKLGKGVAFNGNGSYVELENSTELDLQDTYTVMAWVKPAQLNKHQAIFSSDYGSQMRLVINEENKLVGIAYQAANTNSAIRARYAINSGNITLNKDKWQHVIFSVNGTNAKLYLNGVLITESILPDVNITPNKNKSYIGYSGVSGSFGEQFFNGSIDEVRIYKRTLVSEEISNIYSESNVEVIEKTEFRFEEGDGSVAWASEKAFNGTLINTNWEEGLSGKALKFLGEDSYVNFENKQELDLQDTYTVMAWVKPMNNFTQNPKSQPIFSSDYGSQMNFYLNNDGSLSGKAYKSYENSQDYSISYSQSFEQNRWYHVAFSVSGKKLTLYLNGMKAISKEIASYEITNNHKNSTIGYAKMNNGTVLVDRYFNGVIDELRIYKKELSEYEIKKELAEFSPENELKVKLSFDEDSESVTDSISGNSGRFYQSSCRNYTRVQGVSGNAIELDGNCSVVVSTKDFETFGFNESEYSISTWIKVKEGFNPDNGQIVFTHYNNKTWFYLGLDRNLRLQGIAYRVAYPNSHIFYGSAGETRLQQGVWYNIVMTVKDKQIDLYQNGFHERTKTITQNETLMAMNTNRSSVQIGQSGIDVSERSKQYFNGVIDEARVYDKQLSSAEVRAQYYKYACENSQSPIINPSSYYVDDTNNKIFVRLRNSENPNNKLIEASTREKGIYGRGISNFVISGFKIKHGSNYYDIGGITLYNATGQSGLVVENNSVEYANGVCFLVRGDNTSVKNNLASDCGNGGFGGGGDNYTFESNTALRNNLRGYSYTAGETLGGIKLTRLRNSIVKKIISSFNKGPGIWLDIDCENNIVEKSQLSENEFAGIDIEISRNNIVRNNIVRNNKFPDNYGEIYINSAEGTKIYNNVIYGGESTGINMYLMNGERKNTVYDFLPAGFSYSTINSEVFNNIIVDNKNKLVQHQPYYFSASNKFAVSEFNIYEWLLLDKKLYYIWNHTSAPNSWKKIGEEYKVVVNITNESTRKTNKIYNILNSSNSWQSVDETTFRNYTQENNATALLVVGNNSYDYNIYYGGKDNESVRNYLESWKNVSGQDANSIWANPEFVNASGSDFRLKENSPALNAGIALPEVSYDYFGNLRPSSGRIDIGVHQKTIATCRDNICQSNENCSSCSHDCGDCSDEFCGDNICNNGETTCSCGRDCPGSCSGGGRSRCTDECPVIGLQQKTCLDFITVITKTCGKDYDYDSCKEWGAPVLSQCEANQKCVNGVCVTRTFDQPSPVVSPTPTPIVLPSPECTEDSGCDEDEVCVSNKCEAKEKSNLWIYILVGILALLLLAGAIIFLIWAINKKKELPPEMKNNPASSGVIVREDEDKTR